MVPPGSHRLRIRHPWREVGQRRLERQLRAETWAFAELVSRGQGHVLELCAVSKPAAVLCRGIHGGVLQGQCGRLVQRGRPLILGVSLWNYSSYLRYRRIRSYVTTSRCPMCARYTSSRSRSSFRPYSSLLPHRRTPVKSCMSG